MAAMGFLSLGHADYLPDGNAARIADAAARSLTTRGISLVRPAGIAVTVGQARSAAKALLREDVDGALLFLSSWLECSVALAALRELEHLPVCLWAFPMWREGDREMSTGSYVSGAMLQGVVRRMGLSAPVFFGMPEEDAAEEAAVFCRAAGAYARLRRCRVGLVGYTSMNILTGTFDHLLLRSRLGPDVEQSDSYTLIRMAEAASEAELRETEAELRARAMLSPEIPPEQLRKALGLTVALRKLREQQELDAVNVKCQYEFSKEYGMTVCVPLSLAASPEYITSCEGDLFCTVSQLILRYLTGQITAYGDAIHDDGAILKTSPCGYMPFSLGEGERLVRCFPSGFGFAGLICSFPMKPGRVTLLRVVEDVGTYHLLYLTGEGIPTKPRQGWFPALDVKPDGSLAELRKRYAGQHFAICYGDVSRELEALAGLWHIETERV